jgi:peptide/nickel transport system substrate-binding protein
METKDEKLFSAPITRRRFCERLGIAGGIWATWNLLNTKIISQAFAAQPKRGGVLTFAMASTPDGFDPAYTRAYEQYHVAELCYNRLVLMTPDLKLAPELAERWEHSKKPNEWTFYLRKGIKFHDGKELEAKDVVTSLNYYLECKGPSASQLAPAEKFEVIDKYKVKASLKTPYADFPYNLAKPQTVIVPHHIPREKLKSTIVGTGPFKLKRFVPGERFEVERYADYWDAKNLYLDAVNAVIIPDFATTMNALISGEIDVMWDCEPEQFFALKKRKGLVVHQVPGMTHQDIVMDTSVKPFDDIRVRQAFKACLDREQFVTAVLQGLGSPANDHPIAKFHKHYADFPLKKKDYNLSKKLLAEAGYPQGVEVTLHCSEVRSGMVPSALTLKDQCSPAGIKINVKVAPSDSYWKQVYRKVPFFLDNWGGRETTYSNLYTWHHSKGSHNTAKYYNSLIDSCLDEGVSETEPVREMKLYVAAQTAISELGGMIIPYLRDYTMAHSDKIHGYPLYFNKWMRWIGVWKG